MMFALVVRFDLADEAAARAFDDLVAETAPAIRDSEPDTLVYAVHQVEGAPLARIFYEVYSSREALDRHESNEPVRRFLTEKDRYVTGVRVEHLGEPTGKGTSSFG
jgi:quinol monooxygenase YgiN